MRHYFIPIIFGLYALISLLVLKSVAPRLASVQMVYFLLGLFIMYLVSRLDFEFYQQFKWPIYFFINLFLVVPLLLGQNNRGTVGWINVGDYFSIQPSQLAIPLVSILLTTWMEKFSLKKLSHLIKFLALMALPAGLILLEPDLGTTIIYLVSLGGLILLSPVKLEYLLGLLGLGCLSLFIAWQFLLAPYQKDRINIFSQAKVDLQGAGYNAHQSLIAVGSGRFWGRGLGEGVQSHLRFLPERHTDFIFASLSEELGFLGASSIILLYLMQVLFLLWAIWQPNLNLAQKYFLIIFVSMLTFQTSINIGMNMSLFPITGVTLPLLSYGGSSVLSLSFYYGLVWSIVRKIPKMVVRHLN